MEYYILLATFGLSLVSYTLGLDLLWWLIIFECTSNVNITICLRAPNAIHRGLTLHDIIGVLKISLSEVYIRRVLQYLCCDDGIRSFCVDSVWQSDDELPNGVCTFLIVGFPSAWWFLEPHMHMKSSVCVIRISRKGQGCASLGCSAILRRRLRDQAASYPTVPPPTEIRLISWGSMSLVSDIKLIRTDTTLNLSQTAGKGKLVPFDRPLYTLLLHP